MGYNKNNDIIEHYDKLIDENNDPVNDSPVLKKYMDKWDGKIFIEKMNLNKDKSVLEIGIGTGRLAIEVVNKCKKFVGIDMSPKTIERAKVNLSKFNNVNLICSNFLDHCFDEKFDTIYSSLTFMHIEDKQRAISKISRLLNFDGIFVLSTDKNQNKYIDMGNRKIRIYPDSANDIVEFINNADMVLLEKFETEFANIFISKCR